MKLFNGHISLSWNLLSSPNISRYDQMILSAGGPGRMIRFSEPSDTRVLSKPQHIYWAQQHRRLNMLAGVLLPRLGAI